MYPEDILCLYILWTVKSIQIPRVYKYLEYKYLEYKYQEYKCVDFKSLEKKYKIMYDIWFRNIYQKEIFLNPWKSLFLYTLHLIWFWYSKYEK